MVFWKEAETSQKQKFRAVGSRPGIMYGLFYSRWWYLNWINLYTWLIYVPCKWIYICLLTRAYVVPVLSTQYPYLYSNSLNRYFMILKKIPVPEPEPVPYGYSIQHPYPYPYPYLYLPPWPVIQNLYLCSKYEKNMFQ